MSAAPFVVWRAAREAGKRRDDHEVPRHGRGTMVKFSLFFQERAVEDKRSTPRTGNLSLIPPIASSRSSRGANVVLHFSDPSRMRMES